MKKILFKSAILALSVFVTACSGTSITTEAGHGEYKNKDGTQKKLITIKADVLDNYHLIVEADRATSNNGAVDDANYSLIDSDSYYIGAGFHTQSKTQERSEINLISSKKYYKISAENKRRIWGRLGLISGLSYLNAYAGKRSTTAIKVGGYWSDKNINYTFTYNARNNTREGIDDYVLFGVEKYF